MINIQQEVLNGNINPYDLLDLYNSTQKLLCKDDIESCGWEFAAISYIHPIHKGYRIILNNGILHVTQGHQLFRGTIKNLSEFKRLLKQLNIE
tara:strand:- start:36 stop:314 length:279 start_codon:yes stop_codon:yes gene_type:complete